MAWATIGAVGDALAGLAGRMADRRPGLLRSAVVHARFKPLRYTNARLKLRLNWCPHLKFDEALDHRVQQASTTA
jgi:hypothetical protein